MEARLWNEKCANLHMLYISSGNGNFRPTTADEGSKVLTIFARSNAGVVGSNPTWRMDDCVYFVFVFLYIGSGLATGWSPAQGVPPTVCMIKKLQNSGQDWSRTVAATMQ
jgi:hypothetical protein